MFHLRAKIIGRSSAGRRSAAGAVAYRVGSRAGAAAAAYRAGQALRDPMTGRVFDYSRKAAIDVEGFGILHTEIVLPAGAPGWMADRQALIDAVEAKEIRSDAQLFREIEVSFPRELTRDQQIDLVRAFVREAFVARGMVADIAIHDERASDGGRNPHAHILLSLRSVTPEGFGNKNRAWNSKDLLREWREHWADLANEALATFGHEKRLDPRSHTARDIQLEPDVYIGPAKTRKFNGVLHAERQESRNAAKQENLSRILSDSNFLIEAVSREKATFTLADLGAALRRSTGLEPDEPVYREALQAAQASPQLVRLHSDDRSAPPRFATQTMIACETEMAQAARSLARRSCIDINPMPPNGLSLEQTQAFLHTTSGPDLTVISGIAGAGKTTTLAAIAGAFRSAGCRVRGAALAAVAAKTLAETAQLPAATLASLFHGWDRVAPDGQPNPVGLLEKGDVLILDEASMVGSRDMRRLLVTAEKTGARVILVGDARQLQAIEAGAAFRAIADTHGAVQLKEVRRQHDGWQRTASQLFASGETNQAIDLYRKSGAITPSASTEEAASRCIAAYMEHHGQPGSRLILAHSRADVAMLNQKARSALREAGQLGPDIQVTVREQQRDETGAIIERAKSLRLALGERILFTRNDKALGVQNGSTGTIRALNADGQMTIALGPDREVNFSARDYPHLTHGYAMTVHKAQGVTCDRTYFLPSASIDAHLGYVAMTRHREEARIFYGRDMFPKERDLERAFARQRPKDTTLDYLTMHAADRGRSDRSSESHGAAECSPGSSAPLSAAERIRQNVAQRRRALAQTKGRARSYGD